MNTITSLVFSLMLSVSTLSHTVAQEISKNFGEKNKTEQKKNKNTISEYPTDISSVLIFLDKEIENIQNSNFLLLNSCSTVLSYFESAERKTFFLTYMENEYNEEQYKQLQEKIKVIIVLCIEKFEKGIIVESEGSTHVDGKFWVITVNNEQLGVYGSDINPVYFSFSSKKTGNTYPCVLKDFLEL